MVIIFKNQVAETDFKIIPATSRYELLDLTLLVYA